jgi:hypothetical protein
MRRRFLRRRPAQAIAIVAILAYASAGLFGYGLHCLWRCEHDSFVSRGGHPCQTASAAASESAPHASHPIVRHPDDCAICAFLAQAQSARQALVAIEGCKALTHAPAQVGVRPRFVIVDVPQARGPPLLS